MAEPVEAPLFVVGPSRTGTTILLELLALDPQLGAPLAWEALHPLPRPVPAADVARRVAVAANRRLPLAKYERSVVP
jgi:sulfotransferase family protein